MVYRDIEMRLCHDPFMDMNTILQVSLEDLPHNIRNRFLYCCLYPEDYVMQRKPLVRLWVAEGFVENIGLGALEEFFLKRKVLLILDNYIKMIQSY